MSTELASVADVPGKEERRGEVAHGRRPARLLKLGSLRRLVDLRVNRGVVSAKGENEGEHPLAGALTRIRTLLINANGAIMLAWAIRVFA